MSRQPNDSAKRLVSQVRSKDESAAAEIFRRYAEQLARLAERQLSARVARRVGGEDVVQSVFRSFFARVERGEYQIERSSQLWSLLVKMTLNKATEQGRFQTAELRDCGLEIHDSVVFAELATRSPIPEDAVLVTDAIDRFINLTPIRLQELYRGILELTLAGDSPNEVADQLGVSRRTVERTLEKVRKHIAANGS